MMEYELSKENFGKLVSTIVNLTTNFLFLESFSEEIGHIINKYLKNTYWKIPLTH